MTHQEQFPQIGRIPKEDKRYVLLEKVNNKYYDHYEKTVTVALKIKKYKDYIFRFYDSKTHPVLTIEVFVIDDFDRWYVNQAYDEYVTEDEYASHVEQEYISTFGINQIPGYDKRYKYLTENLRFKVY